MIHNLEKLIKNFSKTKILVIGDLALDKYTIGESNRISPEAPVPIIAITSERYVPGCAANTAHNMSSFKAKVYVVGIIGKDTEGDKLMSLMRDYDIECSGISQMDDVKTIMKERIISKSSGQPQQIARMDYEEPIREQRDRIYDTIAEYVKKVDLIIVSDYNKGLIDKKIATYLIDVAGKNNVRIIVDTKPEHAILFEGVYLMKPNLTEAKKMSGIENINDSNIRDVGEILRAKYKTNIIITRGSKGMALFEEGKYTLIPSQALEVSDVSGAGDTVIASIAMCLASGADLETSARIANCAAEIVVEKFGTAVTDSEELIGRIKNMKTDRAYK